MNQLCNIIYRAAGSPPIANAINAKQWAALRQTKSKPSTPPSGACYLTGLPVGEMGVPVRDRIKDTFTDGALVAAPQSDWLSLAGAWSIEEAAKGGGWQPRLDKKGKWITTFKMRSQTHLVVGDTWRVLGLADKPLMRDVLTNLPSEPWALCICDSPLSAGHALYRTPLNAPNSRAWRVVLGGELIECEADAFVSLLNVVTEQVQHHNKTAIERGDYLPAAINAQGAPRWVELESQIAPHHNTGMLSLAVFLAQKEDDDKKEEAE